MIDMPLPSYQDFASRVGATFAAAIEPDGTVELELSECSRLVVSDGQLSYSLRFRGSAATPLGQATYILDTDDLAPAAVFLVPVRAESGDIVYAAHFTQQEG